jgi:predicted nucleic acid-binding protein
MAKTNGCFFSCTNYVLYECLYKPRKVIKETDRRLKNKLEKKLGEFYSQSYSISIDDLQSIAVLEKRKALSKGELSSIVFAKKTNQAFLTDDQAARKLSEFHLESGYTQTIPHLLGWLSYNQKILDNDKDNIIQEHEFNDGELKKYFEEAFNKAREFILMEKYAPSVEPQEETDDF